MILLGNLDHGAIIAAMARTNFNPRVDQCISRVSVDGVLMGGALYTNYNRASLYMHCAGSGNWLSRSMLWYCYDYPFTHLGVNQVLSSTSSANAKSLNLLTRLGYTRLYEIADAAPGGNMILFSLSKPNCKWLTLPSPVVRAARENREPAHVLH